jgi:protein SCO1
MGKKEGAEEDDLLAIFHGTHFVLVDAQLQIRGYYASDDQDRVETLLRDLGLLVNRGQ